MKKSIYYIWNFVTDENFDTNEMKFYANTWEPILEQKSYLKWLIASDADKFKNCKIVKK